MQATLEVLTRGDLAALIPMLRAVREHGFSTATVLQAWKESRGTQPAVIDDDGAISYREIVPRVRAIAAALDRRGHGPGGRLGLLCRNHRHFVEALCGGLQAGCDVVLMNTGFAGPQLRDVATREQIGGLLADPEFLRELELPNVPCYPTSTPSRDPSIVDDPPSIDALAYESIGTWQRPKRPGSPVILTSGTTGTPKGARRRGGSDIPTGGGPNDEMLDTLRRLNFRLGQRVWIAPPLFHAWGIKLALATLTLGGTIVTQSRFDPEALLAGAERHEAQVIGLVPVMMQRILALPPTTRKRYRLDGLEAVVVSGSALSVTLAQQWMEAFGDCLYNMYGSTEVGAVAIAGPEDMRSAPGTVGHPPRGVSIRILDESGHPVPTGEVGRIFVHTGNLFQGYTGGGSKETRADHMSTGDMGRLDAEGRLFVEGRSDDMVISGGENVFPAEIENLLLAHPEILDAAVIGVPDDEFGQRLRAYVVARCEATLGEEVVRAYVRDHLARYKVPREVVFLDELPRNAAGKVVKRLLGQASPP